MKKHQKIIFGILCFSPDSTYLYLSNWICYFLGRPWTRIRVGIWTEKSFWISRATCLPRTGRSCCRASTRTGTAGSIWRSSENYSINRVTSTIYWTHYFSWIQIQINISLLLLYILGSEKMTVCQPIPIILRYKASSWWFSMFLSALLLNGNGGRHGVIVFITLEYRKKIT